MSIKIWLADFVLGRKLNVDVDPEKEFTERERSLTSTAFYNSWILLVAAACFCVAELITDPKSEIQNSSKFVFGHHLFEELAIAFAVAYLIIITIEYRSRRELNVFMEDFTKRSHENFFQVILGVQFPVRMFELVRNYIMQERVYRQKSEVHFTIRRQTTSARQFGMEIVSLEMVSSFDLINLSDRPYNYPMPIFFEKGEGSTPPEILIDNVRITEQELKIANDAGPLRPGFRTLHLPISLGRLGSKRVKIRCFFNRLIADTMVWQNNHACDGLCISVSHPPELAVRLNSIHPDSLEHVEKNEFREIARISCPLFPGNGFFFWWVQRSSENENPDEGVAQGA